MGRQSYDADRGGLPEVADHRLDVHEDSSMRQPACSFVAQLAQLAQHDLVAFRRGAAIDPWMIQIPPKRFAVIRCGWRVLRHLSQFQGLP